MMKVRMIYKMSSAGLWVLMALACCWFSSCQQELRVEDTISPNRGDLVNFKVGFTPGLRTATDVDFNTQFTDGDAVGIYVVKHAAGVKDTLLSKDNYVDNAKLVLSGTTWKLDVSTPIYYPADGEQIDVYAYYPYLADVSDAYQIALPHADDQSNSTAFNSSDWLRATTLNIDQGQGPNVDLAFQHLMSLVQIELPHTPAGYKSIYSLLHSCHLATSLSLLTGDILQKTDSTPTGIRMYHVPNTPDFRALVPTQTLPQGARLISYQTTDGTSYSEPSLTAPLLLNSGSARAFTAVLPKYTGTFGLSSGDIDKSFLGSYIFANGIRVNKSEVFLFGQQITFTPDNSPYSVLGWASTASPNTDKSYLTNEKSYPMTVTEDFELWVVIDWAFQ